MTFTVSQVAGLLAVGAPALLILALGLPAMAYRPLPEKVTGFLVRWTFYTALIALAVAATSVSWGRERVVVDLGTWAHAGSYHLAPRLLLDSLSLPFAFFTTALCGLVGGFAHRYMHRESGGILMGMGDPSERPSFNETVNWDFLPAVVERGLARFPALERTTVRTGWAGLYEDTPDKHPIIGRVDGVDGFIAAAGFSGHGLMHSPAVGQIVADVVAGREPPVDLAPFRLSRFTTGEIAREHNVI